MIDPIPESSIPHVSTPCFVVFEERILHNLAATARACGGVERLMPHVKTHRASWVAQLLMKNGVRALKSATVTEVQMLLAAGATNITWAYPTVNPQNIARFIELGRQYPNAQLTGLVDSTYGLGVWTPLLEGAPPSLRLRVDLDPNYGRTGVPMTAEAVELARAVHRLGRLSGWHLYDGHIKGSRAEREVEVAKLAATMQMLQAQLQKDGIDVDVIGGGCYTFDIWPASIMPQVSPGSWVYSNAQHLAELSDIGWVAAGFVLATVVSSRNGTATLDLGAKAISPDKPPTKRFDGANDLVMMNEEHTVIRSDTLRAGDRVLLVPEHTCTTAYLYGKALVQSVDGHWEYRTQLGNERLISDLA